MLKKIILRIVIILFFYIFLESIIIAPIWKRQYHLFGMFYFIRDAKHWLPRDDKRIPTNSDGIRSSRQYWEFKEEGFNIIFLGDSFTYGYNLEHEETFVYKIEDLLNKDIADIHIKTANFGWTGSSPILSYRLLKAIGDKYKPDLIVLCLDMSDFFEDIIYKNMIEGRGIYSVYDKIPATFFLLKKFTPRLFWHFFWETNSNVPKQRFFITENPLEETKKYFATTLTYIKKINNYAQFMNSRFVLVILPRSYQYSAEECPNNWEKGEYEILGEYSLEPFKYFEELKEKVDFPIYSLLPHFQETDVFPTCFDDDMHWNEKGNSVAAEAIRAIIKKEVEFGFLSGK